MKNRRIAMGILAGLLVLLLLVIIIPKHPKQTAVDTGGDPYVTIQGDKAILYRDFAYDDYQAIVNRLADFVVFENGSSPGTPVEVKHVVTPYRGNGTLSTFSITIPKLGIKNATVKVDIQPEESQSTFSVSGTSFSVNLYTGK